MVYEYDNNWHFHFKHWPTTLMDPCLLIWSAFVALRDCLVLLDNMTHEVVLDNYCSISMWQNENKRIKVAQKFPLNVKISWEPGSWVPYFSRHVEPFNISLQHKNQSNGIIFFFFNPGDAFWVGPVSRDKLQLCENRAVFHKRLYVYKYIQYPHKSIHFLTANCLRNPKMQSEST